MRDSLEWLKESLGDAGEDYEVGNNEGIPLVPVMDYAETAMENVEFQQLLKALGVCSPFDEQLNGYVNKQNCRFWGAENPRIILNKPIHPPRVSAWCAFWTGGIIGPCFFFENAAGKALNVNGSTEDNRSGPSTAMRVDESDPDFILLPSYCNKQAEDGQKVPLEKRLIQIGFWQNKTWRFVVLITTYFKRTMMPKTARGTKHMPNYLGDKIQNETIKLLGDTIRNSILNEVKNAKYFAILLDCTPDVSHQEQISVCVRYVKLKNTGASVEERFLTFYPVNDATGEGLTHFLLQTLENYGLDIHKCEYRSDQGFNVMVVEAKELASSLDVEPIFKSQETVRPRKIKRQFDYEGKDEPIESEELKFKVNCFYEMLDIAISSYSEQEQFKEQNKLEEALSDNNRNEKDINGVELLQEVQFLHRFNQSGLSLEQALNYIIENNLTHSFPNVTIAIRILLTIPISVATAKRSCSKLKIIKDYLRSTMSQERLENISIISIESDLLQQLEIQTLVNEFATNKSRKIRKPLVLAKRQEEILPNDGLKTRKTQ
ncbi:hypothetical protein YQE_03356, partial [Dendroctonus ponderosae]